MDIFKETFERSRRTAKESRPAKHIHRIVKEAPEADTAYDAKQVVKQLKQAIIKDFNVKADETYYNPASIKVAYYHPTDFLTSEEYDALRREVDAEETDAVGDYRARLRRNMRIGEHIAEKMRKYVDTLDLPEGSVKDVDVSWGYRGVRGVLQIVIKKVL